MVARGVHGLYPFIACGIADSPAQHDGVVLGHIKHDHVRRCEFTLRQDWFNVEIAYMAE